MCKLRKVFVIFAENWKISMANEKNIKISDLTFDDKNFNKHTEFGMSLLEKSLRNNGAGRSILIDKNNRIIGGNGVVEVAGQIGLDDVQIVESDGTKIIAVKRTDIDLDSKQGREMALADNATAAADLSWDAEMLAEVEGEFDISASEWGVNIDVDDMPTDLDAEREKDESIFVKLHFPNHKQATEFISAYKDTIETTYKATISSL